MSLELRRVLRHGSWTWIQPNVLRSVARLHAVFYKKVFAEQQKVEEQTTATTWLRPTDTFDVLDLHAHAGCKALGSFALRSSSELPCRFRHVIVSVNANKKAGPLLAPSVGVAPLHLPSEGVMFTSLKLGQAMAQAWLSHSWVIHDLEGIAPGDSARPLHPKADTALTEHDVAHLQQLPGVYEAYLSCV